MGVEQPFDGHCAVDFEAAVWFPYSVQRHVEWHHVLTETLRMQIVASGQWWHGSHF